MVRPNSFSANSIYTLLSGTYVTDNPNNVVFSPIVIQLSENILKKLSYCPTILCTNYFQRHPHYSFTALVYRVSSLSLESHCLSSSLSPHSSVSPSHHYSLRLVSSLSLYATVSPALCLLIPLSLQLTIPLPLRLIISLSLYLTVFQLSVSSFLCLSISPSLCLFAS